MTTTTTQTEKTTPVAAEADAPARKSKNFRQLPDIENFYRFVYENDLRREAKILLESIWTAYIKRKKQQRKAEMLH